jgi:hypothetical protein
VGAGDLTGERKAETGALNTAAERIVAAIKLFEDFFFAAPGHAEAAVENFDLEVGQGSRLLIEADGYFFAAVRIFFGILEEIDDDLGESVAVAIDEDRDFRKLAVELKAVGFEVRTIGFSRFAHEVSEVASLEVVFLLAAFEAGEIEDIVNETAEASGFGGDDAEIRALLDRIIDAAVGEQFGEHAD